MSAYLVKTLANNSSSKKIESVFLFMMDLILPLLNSDCTQTFIANRLFTFGWFV